MADTDDDQNDQYYKDLLNRVDSTIAQTHEVTFSGAYETSQENDGPLWRVVARRHSIFGVCWHQDAENRFTRPVKWYFFVSSLLLTFFLALELKLATSFADWCIISILLHCAHWGQRFVFYRFQNSLLLWPFFAAFVVLFLVGYDLFGLITASERRFDHASSLAFNVYVLGFLLPEAIFVAYRVLRERRREESNVIDEEYSTL